MGSVPRLGSMQLAGARLSCKRAMGARKLVEDTTREVRLEGIVRVKQMSYMQCQVPRKLRLEPVLQANVGCGG